MGIKKVLFNIKGMTRDLAASKFSPEFAYENKNMRLTATDENTSGVLTNERGNLKVDTGAFSEGLRGTPIGQAVIDNQLILFTTEPDNQTPDTIYKIYFDNNDDLVGEVLYNGNLGFDAEHPIESISVFESDQLKKVYWTDGLNQPRVINVAASATIRSRWENIADPFDFIRTIGFGETVSIERNLVAGGMFAPGVVQYMLTYCTNYGQQSNIFYTSPLYYVSYNNRGASAEDTVGVSFKIQVEGCDTTYDKVRIYAIHRTSINGTPQARVVTDVSIPRSSGTIIYTDYGIDGRTIDATDLLYVGGQVTSIGTLAQKDNVLFMGGINTKKIRVPDHVMSIFKSGGNTVNTTYYKNLTVTSPSGNYTYTNQLKGSSHTFSTYKYGETYRFGLQFQDIWGNWSEPEWIDDKVIEGHPQRPYNTALLLPMPSFTYDETSKSESARIIPYLCNNCNYVNVRPVVVFPTITDRSILCQGVLAPTVYNANDRYGHYADVQSSWFFRPSVSNVSGLTANTPNDGRGAEFRHNSPIPGNDRINAEIQCISNPPQPFLGVTTGNVYTESNDPATWVGENKECYYVDQSVVTMHSPDIEFDKELRSIDSSNLKLRIVGYIPIQTSISDIDIQTSTPPLNYSKSEKESYPDIALGFYKEKVGVDWGNTANGWKSMMSGVFWLDELYGSDRDNSAKGNVGFVVYPWHRNGSLNNTRTVKEGETKSAMLSKKKMSILRYSSGPVFVDSSNIWNAYVSGNNTRTGISGVSIFDSEEETVIKIPEPENSHIGQLVYKGNVDSVITFHTKEKDRALDSDLDINPKKETSTSAFYPIIVSAAHAPVQTLPNNKLNPPESYNFRYNDNHVVFCGSYYKMRDIMPGEHTRLSYVSAEVQTCTNDPVSMKYKSTPHAVIALNYTNIGSNIPGYQRVLPIAGNTNGSSTDGFSNKLFWDPNSTKIPGVSRDAIAVPSIPTGGYLWLAELYDDTDKSASRFGGQTQEAFENNQWLVAGPSVPLKTGNTIATRFTLNWKEGDTYFQRYDCLKTYPFTMEDQNSVVDILSFLCETRVNIDGRYDRNRGQSSNLYVNPSNFNLLNTVYSQRDNFFSYHGMNRSKPLINNFPNTITWSKTKTLGEDVDTWTNLTLASTLDLDGDKGEVRALRKFNNDIISFQDSGIAQILYNENVQIQSMTGVPIEIANSGKVQGKRYISNMIGCTNKYSICSTPMGLYFVNNLTRDINLFNGQITSVSDKLGFHSWTVENLNDVNPWNPKDFNNCVVYYDKINNEVLFITADTCLAFSETLGQFTSFYDYGSTPFFAEIKDRAIALHKDEEGVNYYPYLHHEGEYNEFYGEVKPFWTTVVVNPNPTTDKIFNNVEFRADSFDDSFLDSAHTFDFLAAWNEHQYGISSLVNTPDKPSTLKKKFRIWHAQIPRWNVSTNGQDPNGRDRMRNPWLYLKLEMIDPEHLSTGYKTVLHDLVVDYFE